MTISNFFFVAFREEFTRISICFWKRSPKEQSSEIITKLDQRFQRRFLENSLKNSILLPWQPEFSMESNSANNFQRGPPEENSCQVWFKLAQWFRRSWCLKKWLTLHDRHRVILKAPLEHVVLRRAKNHHHILDPINPLFVKRLTQSCFRPVLWQAEKKYSLTCIQRHPKWSNESGLLQQVVF